MARKRRGRPVDGILVVDKPAGLTSNAVLQQMKGVYFAQKAGHTGALDPLATGVLPICFGEATKFSQFLLDADKGYRSRVQFGVCTDSGDADGTVISEHSVANLDVGQIEQELPHFLGNIKQVPSMYSALKKDGQPLYKLARQGIEVEREARDVRIDRFELIDFDPQTAQASFEVICSKGTYIRSLVEDLGQALGCGAHVLQLERHLAGPYSSDDMQSVEQLERLRSEKAFAELDQLLLPLDSALKHLPLVAVTDTAAYYVRQGQAVMADVLMQQGLVRIQSEAGDFLGIGEILEDGRVSPRRLVAAT